MEDSGFRRLWRNPSKLLIAAAYVNIQEERQSGRNFKPNKKRGDGFLLSVYGN